MEYGLWYDRNDDFELYAYTNADWEGNIDDRKSTSGGIFFLWKKLVSWLSKKKDCIAQSTAEFEYVTATINYTQIVWMKQMLKDIGITFVELVVIHCDNTSIVNMSNNPMMHSKTKHISIKYHFLRDKVAEKKIRLEYISTKENIANIFTKPLPKDSFEYLRGMLGVQVPPSEN